MLVARGIEPAVSVPAQWWFLLCWHFWNESSYILPTLMLSSLASITLASIRELCDFLRFKNGKVDDKSSMRKRRKVCSDFKHTVMGDTSLNAFHSQNPAGWHKHQAKAYIF